MAAASLIFTRSRHPWLDLPIRAWEGDDCSHVGVRLGGKVIDATLIDGVAASDYDDWAARRIVVEEVPIASASLGAAEDAADRLWDLVGQPYDLRGIVGFPLLRDLDQRGAWWCSKLAAYWLARHAAIDLPGRPGRRGVRLVRWAAAAYAAAMRRS